MFWGASSATDLQTDERALTLITVSLATINGIDWETLLTGFLAVGAAWIAIRQDNRIERKRLWREANAARTTLPLVLDEITNWCDRFIEGLFRMMEQADEDGFIPRPVLETHERPETPKDIIPDLKEVLRATDSRTVSRRIALMIGKVQVITSRVDDLADPRKVVDRQTIASHICEVMIIRAQAASLFRYARFREDEPEKRITWDDVLHPLVLFSWDTPEAEEVSRYVDLLRPVDPEHNQDPR